MLAQLLGKKSTPAKRAGGVGAGAGATGFSRRKEPVGFLERLTRKEVALRKVFKDLPGAVKYAPLFPGT